MLNVLYICVDWDRPDGSSSSLLNMLSGLRKKVNPIVLIPYKGVVSEAFSSLGYEVIICPFFYLSQRPFPIWSILHRPSRMRFWRYYYWDKRCVKTVVKHIGGRRIDIVHSNSSVTKVGADIAACLQAKHVWHIREFLDKDFHFRIYKGIPHLRKVIDKADLRICISNAIAEHWHFEGKTIVLYNAVRKKNEAVYCREKNKYFLFCSGGITELKGADFAIRAFGESGVWTHGYSLVFVGQCEPSYRQKLTLLSKSYGVPVNQLSFAGHKDNVRPFFEKATAFLMCSPCEGLGRVTIESMFYGCLALGRDSGGTSEIISNGNTGFLFNTVEECAGLIKMACCNDNEPVIKRAQQSAIARFAEEDYCPKILDLYNCLL